FGQVNGQTIGELPPMLYTHEDVIAALERQKEAMEYLAAHPPERILHLSAPPSSLSDSEEMPEEEEEDQEENQTVIPFGETPVTDLTGGTRKMTSMTITTSRVTEEQAADTPPAHLPILVEIRNEQQSQAKSIEGIESTISRLGADLVTRTTAMRKQLDKIETEVNDLKTSKHSLPEMSSEPSLPGITPAITLTTETIRVISDRNAATSRNRSACIASVSNNSPNSCADTPGVTTSLRSDIRQEQQDSSTMPNDFASNVSSARDHLVPRVELQWVDNQFSSQTEN